MHILISGGGIAGLTLGYWLRRFGHEPVIVERAADNSQSKGFLIDFWGPGFSVVQRMGLVDDLRKRDRAFKAWVLVNSRGKSAITMDTAELGFALQGRFFTFYRGDLEDVLAENIAGSVPIRRSTTIERLRLTDHHVEADLSDGTTGTWDLVIGADGIHSNVRRLVFGEESQFIRHLGYSVAACPIQGAFDLPCDRAYLYNEPDRLLMLFPVSAQEAVAYFVHRTDETAWVPPPERVARLREVFGTMGWLVPRVLDGIRASEELPIFMDSVSQIELPTWSRGRVALVGDACQCLTLLAGQGASMATVGAYVLAGELHRAGGDFQAAFARYEAKLKPGIEKRQREARKMSRLFFVPRTWWGARLRNWVLKLFSSRFLFNRFVLPALIADEPLEGYEE